MALIRRDVISKTFTPVATDGGYTTGQVIGAVTKLADVTIEGGGACELRSMVVRDASNTKGAFDLVFFNQEPANSIGVDGASYSLNDADLTKLIGRISIAALDYVSSGSASAEATIKNIGLLMRGFKDASGQTGKDIWVAMVARDSFTIAASDLSALMLLERY